MNTKDDGGSAFPVTRVKLDEKGVLISATPESGMSLRDWFAGMALQGCVLHGIKQWMDFYMDGKNDAASFWQESMANASYQIADAMLAARKGGKDE